MITWRDGLIRGRRGQEFRQLVQEHCWASTLWISKEGVVLRRFYNTVTREWQNSTPHILSMNGDGKMGVVLKHWVPLETAICIGWRRRKPDSTKRVQLQEGKPVRARYLRWGDEEEEEKEEHIAGETWKPLRWRCGVVPCDGLGYKVSNHGRLMNPEGAVTRGFAYGGRRWAAVRDVGLVDLHAAARLQPKVTPPPAIKLALDALMTGNTPQAYCDVTGVALTTAWQYFTRAAPHVAPRKLARVWRALVHTDLLHALARLKDDPRFGGPLLELMPAVMQLIPEASDFHDSEVPFGELRFARLCMTSVSA